jgi:hypothetical protein
MQLPTDRSVMRHPVRSAAHPPTEQEGRVATSFVFLDRKATTNATAW